MGSPHWGTLPFRSHWLSWEIWPQTQNFPPIPCCCSSVSVFTNVQAACTTQLSDFSRPCSLWPAASSSLECHRLSCRNLSTRALLGISSVTPCFSVDSLLWGLVSKSERSREMEMSPNPGSEEVCVWMGVVVVSGQMNKTQFERRRWLCPLKSTFLQIREGSTKNNHGSGTGIGVWMECSGSTGNEGRRGCREKARIQETVNRCPWAWSTPSPEQSSMDVLKKEANAFLLLPF